ncbi:hypothetical protein BT96DRAFT_981196 [Gymnopus androsaceus JB14]|uniref:DUF6534 domain-containing protein n=1 Tax=Gymnopus androsaceus JB14 TaxID=1447944 RepID=A0A6A4GQF7_9AGAR|nr:hypothetical protein BT96DRAFT_981196 [Gymnopus androsaceus JB14]
MTGLSPAEQAQINISVGGVVVSNYLSYLTMGIILSAGIWSYDWAVANYANPAALGFIHWAIPAESFLVGTCGLTVQLFYAWRLWMMTMRKNWILPGVIGCLSTLGWCTICWEVHFIAMHTLISDLSLILPVAWIWLGSSVGADVLITISMIYYLDLRYRIKQHKMQQNQASHHAPRRFRRLIVRTVECNLLSLFGQAIALSLFTDSSIGFYFSITNMMLSKVYTFSLLVSLNIRRSDNAHGTSNGGFYSPRGRGGVESTALSDLHSTVAFPSTLITADTQQETSANWQVQTTGPPFNANEFSEFETNFVSSHNEAATRAV